MTARSRCVPTSGSRSRLQLFSPRKNDLYAARSGVGVLALPAFAASRRMRLTRVVSWIRSSVKLAPSPAITDPAAKAKRRASAWSSKYRMTCPDIRVLPSVNFEQLATSYWKKILDEGAPTGMTRLELSTIVEEGRSRSKCFSWFGLLTPFKPCLFPFVPQFQNTCDSTYHFG
jgi:hypothetical protein